MPMWHSQPNNEKAFEPFSLPQHSYRQSEGVHQHPLPFPKHATRSRQELKHSSAVEQKDPQLTPVPGPFDYIRKKNHKKKQRITHYPPASISGHVTVHLHWPAAIPIQVNGVHAAGGISVLLHLAAVCRIWVEEANCEKRGSKTTHQQKQAIELEEAFHTLKNLLRTMVLEEK